MPFAAGAATIVRMGPVGRLPSHTVGLRSTRPGVPAIPEVKQLPSTSTMPPAQAPLRTPLRPSSRPHLRPVVSTRAASAAAPDPERPAGASDSSSSGSEAASLTWRERLSSSMKQMDGLWSQFVPMSSLFFFMAFVNTLIDTVKDTLIVTSAAGGPEVIPFLTVYAVLPSSLIFFALFTIASQRFSREALFNLTVGTFIAFFAVFGLYLYPNHATLHPYALSNQLLSTLPAGFKGLIGMFTNWTFTLFYCISELWGDVVLSLLFWGLANDTTNMERAKILYPLFGVGANLAQSAAGRLLKVFSVRATELDVPFQTQLQVLMGIVCVCGVIVVAMHWAISRSFQSVQGPADGPRKEEKRMAEAAAEKERAEASASASTSGRTAEEEAKRAKKEENKMDAMEALRTVLGSPQIKCLAVMALSQGVCTSLLEFAWKAELRRLLPTPALFNAFMGDVAMWTGIVTGAMMFISPYLFQKIGWRGVASASPTILLYGGVTFFLAALANRIFFVGGPIDMATGGLNTLVLQGLAFGGAALYILNRGCKFSLFKPAEEMVYITLDQESRTKGKAAIDVVGAQTGKSASSVLTQLLLLVSAGNMTIVLPVMMAFQVGILRSWLHAVFVLSKYHDQTTRRQRRAALAAAENRVYLDSQPSLELDLDVPGLPKKEPSTRKVDPSPGSPTPNAA